MGFASYLEDIESRRASALRSPPSLPPKKIMEKLKEFTLSSARPLPVILLADISGSMTENGKIQALNYACKEMFEAFRDEDDLRAEIHVAVITFGDRRAALHLPLTPARAAQWQDLTARGDTPLGLALDRARELVEDKDQIPSRAYRPTLVLVSDGQPTDQGAWRTALDALLASERGAKAFRMAMGIGPEPKDVLTAFLANPAERVFEAANATQIRRFFQLVTMSVTSRSRSANPNQAPVLSVEDGWDC